MLKGNVTAMEPSSLPANDVVVQQSRMVGAGGVVVSHVVTKFCVAWPPPCSRWRPEPPTAVTVVSYCGGVDLNSPVLT